MVSLWFSFLILFMYLFIFEGWNMCLNCSELKVVVYSEYCILSSFTHFIRFHTYFCFPDNELWGNFDCNNSSFAELTISMSWLVLTNADADIWIVADNILLCVQPSFFFNWAHCNALWDCTVHKKHMQFCSM